MNLIFEIDRQRILDGSTGAPIASLQFSYPDKYPLTISITRGNQPHPVTGNVYVTLKPASAPLSAPLALLTIPVNGSATATGILDTYIQEMDDWVPAANKRAAQFEILVVSTTGGTEVSVDVPAQVSRRYNSVDQPGVTVAEKSLATQAEAEAGTNNAKWMSPLRVAQAISHLAEFADTTDELSEGTENLFFTTARAKAALSDELSEIGSEISGLNDAIDAEEAARIAGDTALDTKITAETTARTTALSAESQARQTADSALQTQIDGKVSLGEFTSGLAERDDRIAEVETALDSKATTTALSTETSSRTAEDQSLANEINRVEEAQIAGDEALQTGVDSKVSNYTHEDFGEQPNVAPGAIQLRNKEEPLLVALEYDPRADLWTIADADNFREKLVAAKSGFTEGGEVEKASELFEGAGGVTGLKLYDTTVTFNGVNYDSGENLETSFRTAIGAQAAGSYATLDSNNKVPASQIPDLAITDFLGACANQTEMLAKTGQKGDWITRSDDGKVYVITGDSPSNAGSWTALSYPVAPPAPVQSVAGKSGAVTLALEDLTNFSSLAAAAYKPTSISAEVTSNTGTSSDSYSAAQLRSQAWTITFRAPRTIDFFLPNTLTNGSQVIFAPQLGDLYTAEILESGDFTGQWTARFKSGSTTIHTVTRAESDLEKSSLRFVYNGTSWVLDRTVYHQHTYSDLLDTPEDVATGYFDRPTDAASRPSVQGQAPYQVVLANDTRLIDPRRTAWVQPPSSPFPGAISAASLIAGQQYDIAVIGTTDWTSIGFPSITKTGNAASGSTTLVVDWPAFGIANGMFVSGTGIQPGTTVTGGISNTLTISLPTTQAITGSTVTFSNPIVSGGRFTKNSTPATGTGSAIPVVGAAAPPELGTMAYDGSFLYIAVPTPGGQSLRWARTPLSMTW